MRARVAPRLLLVRGGNDTWRRAMAIARNLMTLGLGAGLMYLFDPRDGRRRRALLRDQGIHLGRLERRLLGKAGRDLSNRAHGLAERVRHPGDQNVPDEVLAEREKAR